MFKKNCSKICSILILLFVTGAVFAKSDKIVGNYRGTIDNNKIAMTILFSGNDVEGEYFYLNQLKDIPFKGKIVGNIILLNELDAYGKKTAIFKGHFVKQDPVSGDSTFIHKVIEGTWSHIDGSNSKKFKVTGLIFEVTKGNLATYKQKRYSVAGINDPQKVELAAKQFKQAVIDKDKTTVASFVCFPIDITIKKKETTITSKEQFLELYDEIFQGEFLQKIKDSVPHNMSARFTGVILGDSGEVMFNNVIDNPNVPMITEIYTETPTIFEIKTKKRLVNIELFDDGNIRYTEWAVNQNVHDKPRLIINNGKLIIDGHGGNRHFEFKQGEYSYEYYINYLREETMPYKTLKIYKHKKLIEEDVYV